SVPIVYICAWHAPAFAPLRLISSMMIAASVTPRPEPPYSSGMSAARYPAAVSALTNASRYARPASRSRQYGAGNSRQRARPPERRSSCKSTCGTRPIISKYYWRFMATVADLIVDRLMDSGVRTLFGVPGGGSNLDLIAAAGRAGLPFVLTATETAAA